MTLIARTGSLGMDRTINKDRPQLAPMDELELPAIEGALPNIPWQDAPAGNTAPLWRYGGSSPVCFAATTQLG